MKKFDAPPPMTIDPEKSYVASIDTTAGSMTLDLFPGKRRWQ